MGGLFRAPKVTIPASTTEASAEAVAQSAARSEAAAEDAEREARLRALERARRGLAGTITTSARGVLDPAPDFATRKSLLGE